MAKQERRSDHKRDGEKREAAAPPPAGTTERGKKIRQDVDNLLEEIDEVLEENAEEFVKNYVQKGGE